jgi:hypothetical protein
MEHAQSTPSTIEVGATIRLNEIRGELHRAAYPAANVDLLHALEDEAATLLGVRTARQAPEVVTNCQLYRLIANVTGPTTLANGQEQGRG